MQPWGFDLGSIDVPVHLWQGDEDLMVPVEHGRWLAGHVPGAHHQIVPGGHMSLAADHLDAMLEPLV